MKKTIIINVCAFLISIPIAITGCAAWHSLVVHPIEKLHEIHQNQEQMENYQKTNHVQ